MGNYTDNQLRSAYEKSHAMTNAGIPLVIAGGVLFFVQIRYLVVKYILEMYIGEKNGGGEGGVTRKCEGVKERRCEG